MKVDPDEFEEVMEAINDKMENAREEFKDEMKDQLRDSMLGDVENNLEGMREQFAGRIMVMYVIELMDGFTYLADEDDKETMRRKLSDRYEWM